MKPTVCPSCLNRSFEQLIDFDVVPHSGSFLSEPGESYYTMQLSFEFCSKCALIRRKSIEDVSQDYTHATRTTGQRLPDYAEQIVQSFHQKGVGNDEFIIEVGANDGAFLDVFSQAGFTHRLGIEPSLACAAICYSRGQSVENVHLNQAEAIRMRQQYGPARVVVCRHTLEHISDPLELLLAMRALLYEDGILFIEVPDAHGIIKDLHGHELWDEHLHSFTLENLSLLVHRAGFSVDETFVLRNRGEANILLWCTRRPARPAEYGHQHPFSTLLSDAKLCRGFIGRWTTMCKQILAILPNWPRPIVCIGASHPQSNFLLFTGLGIYVTLLIDDDPVKVGRYVPIPQPVLVVSTSQFLSNKLSGTIIRGAFGYEEWMNRICRAPVARGLLIIEPYPDTDVSESIQRG